MLAEEQKKDDEAKAKFIVQDEILYRVYKVSQNKTPQHENRHICVTP